MKAGFLSLCLLALASVPGQSQNHPRAIMPAFASDSEMTRFLRRLMEMPRASRHGMLGAGGLSDMAAPSAPAAGAPSSANESITNVQMAGVDEGDIVKLHGDYLVILRRGRLFTVNVGGGALRPASVSDAIGRGIDPDGTWYDEMLVAGDRVVVIGYSYQRGGTEVGLFHLGGDGSLRYEQTFQLRSNDYYSSRNYAARLIGTKLVYYAPLYLGWSGGDVPSALPAMQRWSRNAGGRGFQVIARPEHVFRPAGWRGNAGDVTLHTVTACELATPEVQCEATVVIGPPGNVFYTSPSAVYVWMSETQGAMLARIPLDGSAPTAEKVSGSPVDQFSFLESSDGYLNVLTIAGNTGDAMWGAEQASGPPSLLRIALDSLGDGSRTAPAWFYRRLPTPRGATMQNRFVGDFLLYGTGSGWGTEEQSDHTLFSIPWRGGDATALRLSHGVDRIEVMGQGAVVVGVRGNDLEFSGVSLRERARLAQRYTLANASQGELRSHGFFYRADDSTSGILGLPVREAAAPGYRNLVDGSASILFLANGGGRLTSLGRLAAGAVRSAEDGCRASCVDWYGNARPIFARGRVWALLGYELVEGRVDDGAIREVRRVNFGTRQAFASREPD